MKKRQIKLGIMINGAGFHMNAWRDPGVASDAATNINHYVEQTKRAEAAGFSFVFVADGLYINADSSPHFLNRFEPLTILSALAFATHTIGLVGTVSTTYSEPYTVARQFASLDQLSNGRAGWNVVTSPLEGSADNFHKGHHPPHAERYKKAAEHIEVVQGLWKSWETDAFIYHKESGTYFDPNKLHTLNHQGTYYQVKGPLNIARSSQGEPVIFQAGASDAGKTFAAKKAEVVFSIPRSLTDAKDYYKDIKERARKAGRKPLPQVYPSISPVMGETLEEAEDVYQKLKELVTIDEALAYLGRYFDHYDFSIHSLDEAFPDIGDVGQNSFQSVTNEIKKEAKEKNMTLREVALQATTPKSDFFGTYEDVANQMIHWISEEAADGFILNLSVANEQYDAFLTRVIPLLQEKGYHHISKYTTLREQLNDGIEAD